MTIDDAALAREAARLYLEGKPTDSLSERVAASKVVDIGAARARLRPPESFTKSLMRTLANIDAVRAESRPLTDG